MLKDILSKDDVWPLYLVQCVWPLKNTVSQLYTQSGSDKCFIKYVLLITHY